MEYQMTKLPLIAAVLVAAAGLAAPALAATATTPAGSVPYCSSGTDTDFDSRIDSLSTQLQLSTKLNATIEQSNGCLKVTTIADGKTVMKYYDPDSFNLVAEIG
jgi:hypothetical protein